MIGEHEADLPNSKLFRRLTNQEAAIQHGGDADLTPELSSQLRLTRREARELAPISTGHLGITMEAWAYA